MDHACPIVAAAPDRAVSTWPRSQDRSMSPQENTGLRLEQQCWNRRLLDQLGSSVTVQVEA